MIRFVELYMPPLMLIASLVLVVMNLVDRDWSGVVLSGLMVVLASMLTRREWRRHRAGVAA